MVVPQVDNVGVVFVAVLIAVVAYLILYAVIRQGARDGVVAARYVCRKHRVYRCQPCGRDRLHSEVDR